MPSDAIAHAVKRMLKRNSAITAAARGWRELRYKFGGGIRFNQEIETFLPAFAPNSAGSLKARSGLALQAANQTFPFLLDLASLASPEIADPVDIADAFPISPESTELAALFNKYSSDKSTLHDYHLLYANVLAGRRDEKLRVFEIGLGTNDPKIVSTMGINGKPGASLRAFRDFLPNSEIFGADIDKNVLFEEERIKTAFVDQTSPKTFNAIIERFGEGFDLIIDDGLHSPNANIATMNFAMRAMKPGGTLVVEDIAEKATPIWQTVGVLLGKRYHPILVRARMGLMFVIKRPL